MDAKATSGSHVVQRGSGFCFAFPTPGGEQSTREPPGPRSGQCHHLLRAVVQIGGSLLYRG